MLLAVDDAVGELDVLGDADAVADADAEAVGVAVGVGETLGDEDGDGEEVGVCEDDRKGVNINWWVLYREGSGSCGKGCGNLIPDLILNLRCVSSGSLSYGARRRCWGYHSQKHRLFARDQVSCDCK